MNETLLHEALNALEGIRDEILARRKDHLVKLNDGLRLLAGERLPNAGECKKAVADINNTCGLLSAYLAVSNGRYKGHRVSLRFCHTTSKPDAGVYQLKTSKVP